MPVLDPPLRQLGSSNEIDFTDYLEKCIHVHRTPPVLEMQSTDAEHSSPSQNDA